MASNSEEKYIESQLEVETFLEKVKHTLENNGHILLQGHKRSEKDRPAENTNQYTVKDLFANTDITESLKKELQTLKVSEYMYTVKDIKFKKRSPLRVFAKEYKHKNVYIKIRVQILHNEIYVLSFHYVMYDINVEEFPYKEIS